MKKIFLHSLTIRVWHWVNALIVILLMLTSLQLRVPDIALFGTYRSAVLLHKYAGYAMAASFVFWLSYSLLSGNLRRNYVIRRTDVANLFKQARFYMFGIFKGEKNPFVPSAEAKFNGLQKIAYMSTMFVFTPVIVITGILFSDILYFQSFIYVIFGGPRVVDAVHIAFAYVFLIYIVVHSYMAIFLGTALFSHVKAMIFGYEEEQEVPEEQEVSDEQGVSDDPEEKSALDI
jgi:thiosulfate reductase cytochrome b subunit